MNKICVYTCITGNYDNLIEINNIEEGIDYICYTNNKEIKSKTWKVEYIKDDSLTNVQLARKIKILGTPKLNKYDVVVWIDGRIYFEKSIKDFIKEYVDLKNYDLVGFKHFCRNSINNEMIANYEIEKIDITGLNKLDKFYKKEKFPDNCGLIETTLLFRNFNNTKLNKAMQDWFNMILEYSYRDQLSFNYVEWKNKLKVKYLDINIWDNEYFKFNLHRSEHVKISFIPGYLNKFDFKDIKSDHFFENSDYCATFKIKNKTDLIEILFNTKKKLVLSNLKISINRQNVTDYSVLNCQTINEKIYFTDISIIYIKNDFKINDVIELKCHIEALNNYETNIELCKNIKENNILQKELETKLVEKDQIIEKIVKENNDLKTKYSEIINSKRWKALNKILKIFGK